MEIKHFEVISPLLRRYIDYYYVLTTADNDVMARYAAFPTNSTPVCFFYDCGITVTPGKAVVSKAPGKGFCQVIVGNATAPVEICIEPGIKEFCIAFKPLGIHHTQTMMMGTLLQNEFSMLTCFTDLEDTVCAIMQGEMLIPKLEDTLIAGLRNTEELTTLHMVIQQLEQDKSLPFDTIAANMFLSKKHIYRLFKSHLGTTPVQFRNINKFRHAVNTGTNPFYKKKMAAIALESGYYDQAHLIHEFKKVSKLTPTDFQASVTMMANKKLAWKFE